VLGNNTGHKIMPNIEMYSWANFLEAIVSLYENGKTEADISLQFEGKRIEGNGRVLEVKLFEEYAPGIALSMQPETISLTNDRLLRADYMFLNIDADSAHAWKKCKDGDEIRFRATIARSVGPFLSVQLSEFDDDPEIVLMVRLQDCELVS
jgi:hypothetical protein